VVAVLVVDMVEDPTETHPEVAAANPGGKLSFGTASALFKSTSDNCRMPRTKALCGY